MAAGSVMAIVVCGESPSFTDQWRVKPADDPDWIVDGEFRSSWERSDGGAAPAT